MTATPPPTSTAGAPRRPRGAARADTRGRRGHQKSASTDPAAVLAVARGPDIDRTLFVITSKSGSTVETLSFYRYLATRAEPRRFVAITDPGSQLEALARERRFRAVFPHPPDVGGRYAALTVVGMLPAALSGIDGRVLLERALPVDPAGARVLRAATRAPER